MKPTYGFCENTISTFHFNCTQRILLHWVSSLSSHIYTKFKYMTAEINKDLKTKSVQKNPQSPLPTHP